MVDDFNSSKFNSYHDSMSQQYDPCCLYVKNIPIKLSEETFISLMSEGDKKIKKVRIFPVKSNLQVTCALVTYEYQSDATAIKAFLNRKSPFYFDIENAFKADNKNAFRDNSNKLSPTLKMFGRGRGQPAAVSNAVESLKVIVDGNKRITYHDPKERVPDLVPIHCTLYLNCKKKAEFSCAICKEPYCSVSCQVQDWPKHKYRCKTVSNAISKSIQFSNDSSYLSEGSSCSDSDKRGDCHNTSLNRSSAMSRNRDNNFHALKSNSVKCEISHSPKNTQMRQDGIQKDRDQKKIMKAAEIPKTALSSNMKQKVTVCTISSPSSFWIHLLDANKTLSQMEEELTKIQKVPFKGSVDDICCVMKNGKFFRAQILESQSNSSILYFIDYGENFTVRNDQIYYLPYSFKKYRAQAVCCNLVDGANSEVIKWNDDDISSFKFHAENKTFVADVHHFIKNAYNISLINEDGVSLHSILTLSRLAAVDGQPEFNGSELEIPSVLSSLKTGVEVTVAAVEFEGDTKFFGLLDDGSGCYEVMQELENLLQTVQTKEINLSCEEGDVAAGFSLKYNQYYRCVVLKRLRSSFLVRYLDYGNQEEINKLCALTPDLLQKKSYVIYCEKSDSLPSEIFKSIFETSCQASVKSLKNEVVELSYKYRNNFLIFHCYPWYHGTAFKCHSNSEKQHRSKADNVVKPIKKTMKDISNIKLSANTKYDIRVAFIKNASEMYVHLNSEEKALEALSKGINKHCDMESHATYSPLKDEIVCCKFSGDGVWYRAQIIAREKNRFTVHFIDYGNEDTVCDTDIKPLPHSFAIPKFAICVSLHKIKNEDISTNLLKKLLGEVWTMEVKDLQKSPLEVIFYQGSKLLSEFFEKKKYNLKSLLKYQKLPAGKPIDIVICHHEENKFFLHQLKDLGELAALQKKLDLIEKITITRKPKIGAIYCCLAQDKRWYRACVLEVSSNVVKVNYIDYGYDEEVPSKNLKEIPCDLFSHPVYCVPVISQDLFKIQAVETYSVTVVGEKRDMQVVKFLNLPDNRNIKYPTISALKTVSLEKGFNEVIFLYVENNIYYCHLKNLSTDFDILNKKLLNPDLKPLSQKLIIGDLVCAKSEDECWYRASIQSIADKDSKYRVLFIDYGNCEYVSVDNIKCLPDDLLQYPIFCVPVKVTNIERAIKAIHINSLLTVKTVGFSDENLQLVEILLPKCVNLPKFDSLKKQALPLDAESEVSICFMADDIFYTHMKSAKELILALESKLINATKFNSVTNLPEVGDLICAKFTDNIWYRGSVKKVCEDNNSCEIHFIDYGNSEVISLENMKILPSSLCTFPVLSVPLKFRDIDKLQEKILAGITIFPVKFFEMSSDQVPIVDFIMPEDDEEECLVIESQVLPELPIKVVVSYIETDVFYVQKVSDAEKLQELRVDLQQNPDSLKSLSRPPRIGELLNVKFHDHNFYRGVIKDKCSNNQYRVFFVDFGNTDVIHVENIRCLPFKYASLPMMSIAIKFIKSEDALAVKIDSICTVKYTGECINEIHTVTLCSALKPVAFSSLKVSSLEKGSYDVIFISSDCSEGRTFHFLNKTSDSMCIEKMNSLLEKFDGEKIDDHIPTIDEVFVVKCRDGSWQRGSVKSVDETCNICRIYLIDTGVIEEISFSHVYHIPEQISSFPVFCIKVEIENPFASMNILTGKQYNITVLKKAPDGVPVISVFKRYLFSSLQQKSLPLNELRNVIFSCKDNDKLYLRDKSYDAQLLEVQTDLMKQLSSEIISHNPIVGELLCTHSKLNDKWFRCCIVEIIAPEKWKVQFVDFGNEEVVSRENLRPFTSELATYPIFGIAVRISGSEFKNSDIELEHVYPVIAETLPENNVQLVKIVLPSSSLTSISSVLEEEIISANVNPIDCDDSSCELEVSKYFYSSSEYVPFPPGEQDIVIYHVTEECCLFCAPYSQDAIAANLGLSDEITLFCESLKCSSYNSDVLPEIDQLVLAKYTGKNKILIDNQWYRAVILDNSSHPVYDVIFIDYGNSEKVHIDFIRRMDKQFMTLDVQAHCCTLTGFEVDKEVQPSVIQELKNFTVSLHSTPLTALVSSFEGELSVNIPFITKHLMEKNLIVNSQS